MLVLAYEKPSLLITLQNTQIPRITPWRDRHLIRINSLVVLLCSLKKKRYHAENFFPLRYNASWRDNRITTFGGKAMSFSRYHRSLKNLGPVDPWRWGQEFGTDERHVPENGILTYTPGNNPKSRKIIANFSIKFIVILQDTIKLLIHTIIN